MDMRIQSILNLENAIIKVSNDKGFWCKRQAGQVDVRQAITRVNTFR
jgi:hypothetical protein